MLAIALALSFALLLIAVGAPSADASPVTYGGIAADGHLAVFSTAERMVPGDTDNEQDVYVRLKDATLGEYVTKEVSIGPTGGNDAQPALFNGVSSDGTEVFFSTVESLTPNDGDHDRDIYVRNLTDNTTTLISQAGASCLPEGCGASASAGFVPGGVVANGSRLFFATKEQLSAADTDSSTDIYMRDLEAEETILVSQGDASCAASSCGNGEMEAQFKQASSSGDKVFFTTNEGLVAGDGDGRVDIYERDLSPGSEATELVSVAGTCPAGLPAGENCDPTFRGISTDGSHAFFESNEQIDAADEDSRQDVYDWPGAGAATLVSTGPSGGNGSSVAIYSGNSADGSAVYFKTPEALDSGDTDTAQDVYERAGGVTTLISTGPSGGNGAAPADFDWASPDGSGAAVFFDTAESLTAEDTDGGKIDVYEREGGTTTLVSTGPEAGAEPFDDASFAGASHDGSRAFFVTSQPLVAEDEDESSDIYMRDLNGETTTLVSEGFPTGGNGAFSAGLHGVSENGSKAFFVTGERLTVDDDYAKEDDVYSWSAGTTLLVSVKNSSELVLGPEPPFLEGTNPSKSGQTTEPKIVGQAEAGALIKIYKTSDCSGEQVAGPSGEPAGGAAEELASPGIAVKVAEATKTTFYATAELEGVVSPCSNGVPYTQENPPPPPPPPPPGEEEGSGGNGEDPGTGSGGGTKNGSGGTGGGSKTGGGSISYVMPQTLITFGPGPKTRKRKVVFRFSDASGQPGSKFFCKLDRKRWRECGSPKRLAKLKLGRHVFKVKAVNAVGTWDDGPAKFRFKVVR